jgi:hypothetical protein
MENGVYQLAGLVGLLLLLVVSPIAGASAAGHVAPLAAPTNASAIHALPSAERAPRPSLTVDPTTTYSATINAVVNTTATTITINSGTTWTLSGGKASLAFGALGVGYLTANGTVTLTLGEQLEVTAGCGKGSIVNTYLSNVGTVWANLTVGATTYGWSATINTQRTSSGSCPADYVELAPSWSVTPGSTSAMSLALVMTPIPTFTFNHAAPVGLVSVQTPGSNGVNGLAAGTVGSAGACPLLWGWSWLSSPFVVSNFNWAALAASGSVTWVAAYKTTALYNSVTQSSTLGGTFLGSLGVKTIKFTEVPSIGGSVPATKSSYVVNYTVLSNVTASFAVTYSYTIGVTTTTSTLSANAVYPYNATYSLYVYTAPTPFGGTSRITMAGETGWNYVSSWPNETGTTWFYQSNTTVVWHSPIPNATQVTFVAPNVYTPSTLTIVYVPASPVYGLFGASLPYTAVLTYVNGVFEPYATFGVSIGTTYEIRTFDVFNQLLSDTNVTATTPPAQVATVSLNIWPMTVANENSSYVIGLLLTANSVTQTSPDIMPLESNTFYLPAGSYTFTLNYLLLSAPTIAKTVMFTLNITGVSYSVVTGLTFLNIQVTTQMTGGNISRLVQTVSATLIQTNSSVAQLVTSIQNGLFAFHLDLGAGSRTKDVFSFPVFVTNGANGAVNATLTTAIQSALTVTYLNGTGSTNAGFYATTPVAGSFTMLLSPSAAQVAEVTNGIGVFILTSIVKVGGLTVVAAGVVTAANLNGATEVGAPAYSALNQQLLLNLGNTTRNSSSGYETSSATWTNPYNVTFAGQVVLTGSWLSTANDLTIYVGNVPLNANLYSVTPTEVILFGGDVNVSVGGTLTVSATYLPVTPFSLTAPIGVIGSVQITPASAAFIVLVIILLAVYLYERLEGKHKGLAFGLLSFSLLVGGIVFL